MAIIVEGVDNSGKSTLARLLARRLDYTLVESEGPPKYKGEMNARIEKYFSFSSRTVYARHPCVSQPIYAAMRGDPEEERVTPQLLIEFYDQHPLFIYCDPQGRGLVGHDEKGHDNPDHLDKIKRNYSRLCMAYQEWAMARAHLIYRIGDSMEMVVRGCAAMHNANGR